MSFNINKKDRLKFQEHPKVKIYYLRNDLEINRQTPISSTQKVTPTVSCLSSFIQNDKNAFLLHPKLNNDNTIVQNVPQQDQINLSQITNQALQASINKRQRKISQTETDEKFKRNAFTAQINGSNYTKPNVQNLTVQLPTKYYQKRFTKTSQQQSFPVKNQNNQALSKDFLCNIVKEWNHFTERQDNNPQRTKSKKWKMSVDSRHKTYRPEEMQELKKNKTLMNEHFNLFLQNQKSKRQNKKQKGLTLLKAVFNRDYSHHSISNKHLQNENRKGNSETRRFQNQKSRDEKMSSSNHEQKKQKRRNMSLNQKVEKNHYLRLMYGPQVKLIPRLFEQRSKIRNFDWTRLDRQVFDSKKKMSYL